MLYDVVQVIPYKNYTVYVYFEDGKIVCYDAKPLLVQRILSNRHIDLSDFSYAALSSIAVATATPHSSALHMRKSSCVNIADT